MNYASVESSERLQRVLAVLKVGGWHSTFDINVQARVTSAGTAIAELERNGYTIAHRKMSGRQSYEYRLVASPPIKAAPVNAVPGAQTEMFQTGFYGQAVDK